MSRQHIRLFLFGTSIVCVGLLFLLSLTIGSVAIPLPDVIASLSGGTVRQPSWEKIVWQFRLPKALCATAVGAALAVSGLQLQTLFNNPLAGPFALGISSGASLGVAIVVLAGHLFGAGLIALGNWVTVIAAWIGAMVVTAGIIVISKFVQSASALLILGLMVGFGTGAVVNIFLQLSSAQQVQQFVSWTFGSFGGVTWAQLPIMLAGIGLGLLAATASTIALNVMTLGEAQAKTLGVNLDVLRLSVLLSSSLLAGVTTAFCGPIAFLGVAVPHLARSLLRTGDLRWLLPACMVLGAGLAIISDLIAQTIVPKTVLPLNSVTALIGTPIIISVILNQNQRRSN
jgi:iron complex transport system permease protein